MLTVFVFSSTSVTFFIILNIFILNWIWYAQQLCIYLYNDNDILLYDIFYHWHILIQIFFSRCDSLFLLRWDLYYLFVNAMIFFLSKLIISVACYLKDSQNFFRESSPLYISRLFSISPSDHIVDIKNYTRYVHILSLWIVFQDYFRIHLFF